MLYPSMGVRMRSDLFGSAVTLTTADAVDHWNKTQMAFLAHGAATPLHLGALLEAAPHFALGQATKGLFMLMLGRSELTATAEEARRAAHAAMSHTPVTPREALYVQALDAWLTGHPTLSIDAMEKVLHSTPEDALAMKISHAIRFILGDASGMRSSIEAVLPKWSHDHPAMGYLLGCHSFALEETGDYARAETAGRRALALAGDDAWGLHAVAHVYDMTGNSKGGIDWLTGREAAWAHCNNFRYHVWWHKALMHLDQGDIETVLALYDSEIRSDKTDDYRDISNATSLLSRLELEGVNVGDRWDELADISEKRTEDGCLIFADMHYMLALIGGSRDEAIQRMLGRLHHDARSGTTEKDTRMANPGIAAMAGLEALGESDFRKAFLNLAHARPLMQRAGGSHAQRDVFERLTIDAGIRAGFLDEAEAMLTDRKAKRNGAEDAYAAARFQMISNGRRAPEALRLPAE